MGTGKRLDQILQTKGLVTDANIRRALNQQKLVGGKLGEHLLRSGDISEAELVDALSEQFGVPGFCVGELDIDPSLFGHLPLDLAERHHCIPVSYDEPTSSLRVAFADPRDHQTLRAVIQAIHPARVIPYVAVEICIHTALARVRVPLAALPTGGSVPVSPFAHDASTQAVEAMTRLLEWAVTVFEEKSRQKLGGSAWTARLASEIAARFGLEENAVQTMRLAAMMASCSCCRTGGMKRLPVHQAVEASLPILGDIDLPWDVTGLLHEAIRRYDAAPLSVPAGILRVCLAIAEFTPEPSHDEAIDVWQERVVASPEWKLDAQVAATAFSILRAWQLRRRLGEPPAEVMVIGSSLLSATLIERLREASYRVVNPATVTEGLALVRRRAPDLVCVHIAEGTGPSYEELTDILGAVSSSSSRVFLVVEAGCGKRTLELAKNGVVEIGLTSDGVDRIVERIRQTLAIDQARSGQPTAASSPLAASKAPGSPSVTGHLTDLGLGDLVQVLSSAQKTVHVIFTRPGHRASLWFRQGQIVHVSAGGLTGDEAFFHLVGWSDGEFEVHPGDSVPIRNVVSATPALLLEGYRRLDEARRNQTLTNAL